MGCVFTTILRKPSLNPDKKSEFYFMCEVVV